MLIYSCRLEAETKQLSFSTAVKVKTTTCRNNEGAAMALDGERDASDSWWGATWRTAVFALRQVAGSPHISKMRDGEEKMTVLSSQGAVACRLARKS